jgi:hypothetical protein
MSEELEKSQSFSIEQDEVHDATANESGEGTAPDDAFDEEGVDVQQGVATINAEEDVPPVTEENASQAEQAGDDMQDDEIKPTDIVFTCPSCNSSLAIDYRGAGLEINCTQCGLPTLVPIPAGMEVSDLDLSTGELLVQLFQTRTIVNKRDQQIAELAQVIESLKLRRGELERSRMNSLRRYAELAHMCQSIARTQTEVTGMLNRMLALIAEEQQL